MLITIINEEVKNYFNSIDLNPKKVYYHYSNNLFTNFIDQSNPNYKREHSLTNRGIYFHDALPQYKYGKNKYEVNLDIKNPFIINNGRYISDVTNPLTGKKIEIEHINDEDIKFLENNGFDAVIGKYPSFQTVVFHPEQIKILRINDIPIEKYLKIENE